MTIAGVYPANNITLEGCFVASTVRYGMIFRVQLKKYIHVLMVALIWCCMERD